MKKNVFHELAWFKTRETLKPMPKWWYAWKWFSILFMPMFISILYVTPTYLNPALTDYRGAAVILSFLFLMISVPILYVSSAYFQWVDKYKDEYLQLRKSYTFYSERDFFLSVKSSMVKEWEQEKEKTRKHQLEKSNAIKKKYDL